MTSKEIRQLWTGVIAALILVLLFSVIAVHLLDSEAKAQSIGITGKIVSTEQIVYNIPIKGFRAYPYIIEFNPKKAPDKVCIITFFNGGIAMECF